MKVLVYFVNFHPDNYQGAQGNSFEFQYLVSIPDNLPTNKIAEFVFGRVEEKSRNSSPYDKDRKFAIMKMELFL